MTWATAGNQTSLDASYLCRRQAYSALLDAANHRFRVTAADEFTVTVSFDSAAGLLTWGEDFTAQVVPLQGGASLRVYGVAKWGGALRQNAHLAKMINQLFDDATAQLRSQTADRSEPDPPPDWYPDPEGEAEWRWWDGAEWTSHASD